MYVNLQLFASMYTRNISSLMSYPPIGRRKFETLREIWFKSGE